MSELDKITARFARAYDRQKKAKSWLEKSQRRMFSVFDDELAGQPRGQRTDRIPEGEDQERYVKKYHPGWHIVDTIEMGGKVVILEEDPSLLGHSYTNADLGMVFSRTPVVSSPSLDDERLRTEKPDLWERISEWPEPWWSLVRDTCQHWIGLRWSDEALDSITDSLLRERNVQRVLKDLNTISVDDLTWLQDYIIPGSVSVRLVPPRKAKEDEL